MYQEFFNDYFQKNKGLVIGDCVITILIFPLEIILLSWLTGNIFLHVKKKEMKQFWFYTTVFFLVFFSVCFLYYLSELLDSYILPSLQVSVRKSIFEMINNKKVGLNNIKNGELITKLLKIPGNIFNNFMNIVTFIIPFMFGILFFCAYMFYIYWGVGLASFLFFVGFAVAYIFYFLRLCKLSNERFNQEGLVMNEFEDVLRNNENILLHNTMEFEGARLTGLEKKFEDLHQSELAQINHFKIIFIALLCIFMFSLVIYTSWLAIKDKVTIVKLVMLVTAALLMLKSFSSLVRRCCDSIVEVGPILLDKDFEKSIKLSYIHFGSKKDFFQQYRLHVRNLSYKIKDKTILSGIDFEASFGSSVLITGEIGSGKSTFLKLLVGYHKPEKEVIFYDGVDILESDVEYLRNHVTMMHQSIVLFRRPVLENILYGLAKDSPSWKTALQELESMPLYHHVQKFINIQDSSELSGGQKQIVLLLRCYFKQTKILFMDEPTANVDPETKNIIIDLIELLKTKMTILCVSHDTSLFKHFATRYEMKNGKLFLK